MVKLVQAGVLALAFFPSIAFADIAFLTRLAKDAYVLYSTGNQVLFNRCLQPVASPTRDCSQDPEKASPMALDNFEQSLANTLLDYVTRKNSVYRIRYRESDGLPLADTTTSSFYYKTPKGILRLSNPQIAAHDAIEISPRIFAVVGREVYDRSGLIFVEMDGTLLQQKMHILDLPPLQQVAVSPKGVVVAGNLKGKVFYGEVDAQGKMLRKATVLDATPSKHSSAEYPDKIRLVATSDGRYIFATDMEKSGVRCVLVGSFSYAVMKEEWLKEICVSGGATTLGDMVATENGRVAIAVNTGTTIKNRVGDLLEKSSWGVLDSEGSFVSWDETEYRSERQDAYSLAWVPQLRTLVLGGVRGGDIKPSMHSRKYHSAGWLRLMDASGRLISESLFHLDDFATGVFSIRPIPGTTNLRVGGFINQRDDSYSMDKIVLTHELEAVFSLEDGLRLPRKQKATSAL